MKNFCMIIALVILITGCTNGCADGEDGKDYSTTTTITNNTTAGNSVTLISMDEYDGTTSWGRWGTQKLDLLDEPLCSARDYNTAFQASAFITFDLSSFTAPISSAKIGLFTLEFDECDGTYEERERLYLYRKIVPQGDYLDWTECYTTSYPYGDPTWIPEGCTFLPTYQGDGTADGRGYIEMSKDGLGWWTTTDPKLVNLLNSSAGKLITFAVDHGCYPEDYPPGLNVLDHRSIFEDGGNHGGSGNVPFLKIVY